MGIIFLLEFCGNYVGMGMEILYIINKTAVLETVYR